VPSGCPQPSLLFKILWICDLICDCILDELESSCNPSQSEAVEELLPVKTLAAPPSPVRTAPIDPPASRKSTLTSTKPGKRHFENAADGKVENLGSEKKKAREEQGDDILNDVEQLENNVKENKSYFSA
jgi:hypothetical protein